MAAQTARTKQRAMAVHRLIEASNAVAEKFGVEPPAIPMHHRDPAFLPTLQIEAVVALLERITADAEALEGRPEAIAALRQQIHEEFLASIVEVEGEELEMETLDIDVVAAYEAYVADERATGPDDQFAFQDAVLGAFGVSFDGPDDVEADVAEIVEPDAPEPDTAPEEPAPVKRTRKKADS